MDHAGGLNAARREGWSERDKERKFYLEGEEGSAAIIDCARGLEVAWALLSTSLPSTAYSTMYLGSPRPSLALIISSKASSSSRFMGGSCRKEIQKRNALEDERELLLPPAPLEPIVWSENHSQEELMCCQRGWNREC